MGSGSEHIDGTSRTLQFCGDFFNRTSFEIVKLDCAAVIRRKAVHRLQQSLRCLVLTDDSARRGVARRQNIQEGYAAVGGVSVQFETRGGVFADFEGTNGVAEIVFSESSQPCRKGFRPFRIKISNVSKCLYISDLHHVGGIERSAPSCVDFEPALNFWAKKFQQVSKGVLVTLNGALN